MKKFNYILLLLLALFTGYARAQDNTSPKGTLVKAKIIDGDTIPVVDLNYVYINQDRTFKSDRDADKWRKMKRDVKRVYPYAILAAARLKEYNNVLATMNTEGERKSYM